MAKKYTEAEMQSNELKRIENEENRIENEAERVANEIERIAKEEIRNEFYDGFNDRLDSVNSQLAHITNYVSTKMFNFYANGVDDDSENFNNLINYCEENEIKTIKINNGIYKIGDITFSEDFVLEFDEDAKFLIKPNSHIIVNSYIKCGKTQIFDFDKAIEKDSEGNIISIDVNSWGVVKGRIRNDVIYPEYWGCKNDGIGDGVSGTDNYFGLKALSMYVSQCGYGDIHFSEGVYFIKQHLTNMETINWENCNFLNIRGVSTKIDFYNSIDRNISINYNNLSLFQIKNCKNVNISSFTINQNGDKAIGSSNKVSRSGIEFFNCSNVFVRNLEVKNSLSAGICIWSDCSNFEFVNVSAKNNSWGALIIEDLVNGRFINCDFSYSGVCGTVQPISQTAGILIESKIEANNILFYNCTLENNIGCQLLIGNPETSKNITLKGGIVRTSSYSNESAIAPKCQLFKCIDVYCDFTNGGYIRAQGFYQDKNANAIYKGNTIIGKNMGMYSTSGSGYLIIEENTFIRLFDENYTSVRFPNLQGQELVFSKNNLSYPKELIGNSSANLTVSQIKLAKKINDNIFSTDLDISSESNNYIMIINTEGAYNIKNNTFISPDNKSIGFNSEWDNNYIYSNNLKNTSCYGNFLGLMYDNSVNTIEYRKSRPSSGKYKKGDIVLNLNANTTTIDSDTYIILGWICIESGEPGIWSTMKVLSD